jgi:hypothetical protein
MGLPIDIHGITNPKKEAEGPNGNERQGDKGGIPEIPREKDFGSLIANV